MLASTFVIFEVEKTNLNILASIYSPQTIPHNKLLYTVYNSEKKVTLDSLLFINH